MKTKLLSGVLALVLTSFVGIQSTGVSAASASDSWSIAVHLAYADGSAYDIVLATGVPPSEVHSMLAECGRSHRQGSVVRYHCYPIAE
ncbi:MAG TPA: hypothetical protein VFV98_01475 [Vicinamibacterales bacterium]|nr:hypothetical protein [Vicinamibacterales bacterium]